MNYYTMLEGKNWALYMDNEKVLNGTETDFRKNSIFEIEKIDSYIMAVYNSQPWLLEKSFLEWERGKR